MVYGLWVSINGGTPQSWMVYLTGKIPSRNGWWLGVPYDETENLHFRTLRSYPSRCHGFFFYFHFDMESTTINHHGLGRYWCYIHLYPRHPCHCIAHSWAYDEWHQPDPWGQKTMIWAWKNDHDGKFPYWICLLHLRQISVWGADLEVQSRWYSVFPCRFCMKCWAIKREVLDWEYQEKAQVGTGFVGS